VNARGGKTGEGDLRQTEENQTRCSKRKEGEYSKNQEKNQIDDTTVNVENQKKSQDDQNRRRRERLKKA